MKYGILITDTRKTSKELSQFIFDQLRTAKNQERKLKTIFNPDFTPLRFEVVELPDKLILD